MPTVQEEEKKNYYFPLHISLSQFCVSLNIRVPSTKNHVTGTAHCIPAKRLKSTNSVSCVQYVDSRPSINYLHGKNSYVPKNENIPTDMLNITLLSGNLIDLRLNISYRAPMTGQTP